MKKYLKTICKNNEGTALLVALLVMGVFTAISVVLSTLIIRESRTMKHLLDSGAAYYAAESAIEEALFKLDNTLPGWEPENNGIAAGDVSDRSSYKYELRNKCNSYPCFDEREYLLTDDGDALPVESLKSLYDILDLNETVTVPLFIPNEGGVDTVEDFTVEFYTAFDPSKHLNVALNDVGGWDVLRWKVFGMKEVEGSLNTDAIHDFTAVSALKNLETGDYHAAYAEKPSWFGTVACSEKNSGRISTDIKCEPYTMPSLDEGLCDTTGARDYYSYSVDGKFDLKHSCYPIKNFVTQHSDPEGTGLVYLTLTNLMNPSMLKDEYYPGPEERAQASRIFYRIETYDDSIPREFATIIADGKSGDSTQSIEVKIQKDSYMPVFNFSLYSTYKKGGDNYYYDDEAPQELSG